MRFKAYDISELINNGVKKTTINEDLFSKLNLFPLQKDGSDNFAPLYMHEYGEFILGTFAQSYFTELTQFDENNNDKKEIVLGANNINDKTYFYIDKENGMIYIQGKLYPSTLNASLTRERITFILKQCIEKDIVLIPASFEYTIDEINEIFTRSFVKKIVFKNLQGLTLPKGALLHNPRKDLDESMAESWNTYSASSVDYLEMRSKDGEKLSKNPIAKIGMILSRENRDREIFQNMEIIDAGERVVIKQKGNENKIIYVSKKNQENPQETYAKIMKKYYKNYEE